MLIDKRCPKCGEQLHEKDKSRYCRNGCEIVTAAPHGSPFNVRQVDVEHTRIASGGLRRTPYLPENN